MVLDVELTELCEHVVGSVVMVGNICDRIVLIQERHLCSLMALSSQVCD
jgi:hypothetical protein